MKKLHELLALDVCEGDLGVEIECEGHNLQAIMSDTWVTERDGSLRGDYPNGAAEFVMRKPVTQKKLLGSLRELIKHQQSGKAKFNFSFRTSVHVHVNVQTLTEDEMLAFLYSCMLLEDPLMNFCGESRKGNRFCLRLKDAEGYDKTLHTLFQKGYKVIRALNGDNIRYSAINIDALRKYGSIEFRGMRGNMDVEILVPWCETLLAIRNNSKKLGSPVEVYNKYISQSNTEFAKDMMGVYYEKFQYPDMEKDMNRSFSLTINLPHVFKARDKKKEEEDDLIEVAPWAPPVLKKPVVYIPERRGILEGIIPRVEATLRFTIDEEQWDAAPLNVRINEYVRIYKIEKFKIYGGAL